MQGEPANAATNLHSSPDWPAINREIACPLCGYNLRGLIEPRCPECGHRSTWEVLLAEPVVHPYLFEHQPKRNVRSWWRTMWTSARRPRVFWSELLAVHRIKPLRLAVYAVVLAVAAAVAMVPMVGIAAVDARVQHNRNREAYRQWLHNNSTLFPPALRTPDAIQASVNSRFPPISFWRFFSSRLMDGDTIGVMLLLALLATAVWPAATIASLLVYRASMAQARIHTGHVVRCAVYSVDLLTLPLAVTGTVAVHWLFALPLRPIPVMNIHPVFWSLIVTQWVMSYRLIVAYRKYLAFPHAAAAVIAGQVIVFLLVWKIALMQDGY